MGSKEYLVFNLNLVNTYIYLNFFLETFSHGSLEHRKNHKSMFTWG